MLRVLALDQSNMDREAGGLGEIVQERRGKVGLKAACSRRGEIGVRRDEWLPGRFDDHHRQRLVGRNDPEAARCHAFCRKEWLERRAQGGSRLTNLGFGLARGDLQQKLEPSRARELLEEVVQDREPGRDAALACTREIDLRRAGARHCSLRSIDAPRARSRSSIRSYPRSIWRMFPIVDVPSAHSAAMSIAIPARMSGLSSRSP